MWDLIVSVPDHCLSFYLPLHKTRKNIQYGSFLAKSQEERGKQFTFICDIC